MAGFNLDDIRRGFISPALQTYRGMHPVAQGSIGALLGGGVGALTGGDNAGRNAIIGALLGGGGSILLSHLLGQEAKRYSPIDKQAFGVGALGLGGSIAAPALGLGLANRFNLMNKYKNKWFTKPSRLALLGFLAGVGGGTLGRGLGHDPGQITEGLLHTDDLFNTWSRKSPATLGATLGLGAGLTTGGLMDMYKRYRFNKSQVGKAKPGKYVSKPGRLGGLALLGTLLGTAGGLAVSPDSKYTLNF